MPVVHSAGVPERLLSCPATQSGARFRAPPSHFFPFIKLPKMPSPASCVGWWVHLPIDRVGDSQYPTRGLLPAHHLPGAFPVHG